MDYRDSGVDIDAGNEVVRRIRGIARSTFTPAVLSDIGTFGGLFQFDSARFREPVLVSSADGVGTKLKVAFLARRHDTIGIDLVNHCVNDILVQGAEPLFFLDYLATGRLSPDVAVDVVRGLADGCRENECALLGGETAEMPGFYANGEYDLAGFIVGVVDKERVITGAGISEGDALIGLPSSGLHTNGYSLARAILFDRLSITVEDYVEAIGSTVGDALLRPHKSYLHPLRPLLRRNIIKGMAHITGGGMTDNLPRILPRGTSARVETTAWEVPALFRFLQREGRVTRDEMYRTFNMGIGLILVCPPEAVDEALASCAAAGEPDARRIGAVARGDGAVVYV